MTKNPTVIEMVARALEDNENISSSSIEQIVSDQLDLLEFDGLMTDDCACHCTGCDLMICNSVVGHCKAAYKIDDPSCEFDYLMSFDEPEENNE